MCRLRPIPKLNNRRQKVATRRLDDLNLQCDRIFEASINNQRSCRGV